MFKKIIFVFLLITAACNFQGQALKNKQPDPKWSIRMANTILTQI